MEKIYVSVRARPLTPDDSKSSPWKIQGNSISLSTNQSTKFDFDRIFMEDSRTADIFEARTKVIVASAVRGFNGTVFAYGQTSSGKTHTMRGNSAEPGIIPLAVYELFATIQEDACREFLVRMSYMEIYNEEINDLLAPEHRKLQIHESLERGIYVAGLKEEIVSSPKQVLDFMEVGESHRHIGQTNMNLYSSRSHTIFRMIIESREKPADGDDDSCDAVRVSILNLVDLAGSERAAKTGAEGMRLKEGSHINKSLMTLGTVIKKLSEGTESQRGHVPYRDSKLTRILQPALGGNANTAIICNITLAQIHTDETKSTLQFASRALQVTNCACVNEILTDGVLLKRQRKEIEELRAKLLSSHSEHLEEEILNLRNTLLQSELEKERIAMELEVEKKDKAYRERRLAEQEKKIENLSSLVLYSERDEKNTNLTKNKRRVTWCPRSLSQKLDNLESTPNEEALNKEYSGDSGDADLLPPFSELMQEHDVIMDDPHSNSCIPGSKDKRVEFSLPDKHALLHVTSRRKVHQGRDEPLLMKTAGTESLESECSGSRTSSSSFMFQVDESAPCALSLTVRESEEIPITMLRELEDQVRLVEMEKTATQRNLDVVLELATEQNACFSEICNQESKAFLSTELSNVVQEIALQVDHAKNVMDSVLSFVGDVSQNLFNLSEILLDVRSTSSQNMVQFESIICGHSTIQNYARKKMDEFELEKNLLENQLVDHQKQIQELESNLVNWEKAMEDQHIQHELEKDELLGQVLNLEKELSCSSYPTLAREKDTLRKEVDKTKQKLKDAEAKLKNAIQDKTRLENEKTQAEREVKRLVGQRAILDRDIWRRDSIVDRRQSKSFDCGNAKGSVGIHDQNLQMEYQKLFFEMEAEINSLREALITATTEKEDAYLRNKNLHSELNLMTENFDAANLEIKLLKEEIIKMEENLGKSEFISRDLKVSLDLLSKEKEEMGMQLTDALLEMEIEKSTWLDKEKDLVQLNDRIKLSDDTIASLSKDLSEVRHELESSREQNKLLKENAERERECSVAIRSENAEIRNELEQLEVRRDEYEDLLSARTDAEELARRLQSEASVFGKEKTKLRMQLRSTQSKLDAFRVKYKEEVEVKRIMDMKFKDASSKYREKLRQLGNEVLDLKNQLVNRKQN